ncbi:MAG: hypothetical protein KC535_00945 [Nanoarchaeota archaeon]|nr:hypothetical protein [Nanoarchaeota archaeon]
MKRLLFTLIILSFLLTSCGVQFGQNYEHLQNQDPARLHEVNISGETNKNIGGDVASVEEENLYEHLNENLCDLKPECCNQLTDEQKDFRDLELRAVVEENVDLCYGLPDDPFVISCGNDYQEDEILYSKSRCLAFFEQNG